MSWTNDDTNMLVLIGHPPCSHLAPCAAFCLSVPPRPMQSFDHLFGPERGPARRLSGDQG